MMRIGELAKRTQVSVETIRFYERSGVLPHAHRSENGRRTYIGDDVDRLLFIRRARSMGFDLASVRVLLKLQSHPQSSCGDAAALASTQLRLVRAQIAELTILSGQLADMAGCSTDRAADCRVIHNLMKPASYPKRLTLPAVAKS